ncbi:MAG TPA: beta-L-arabinofuranosidase domain-containing protein [Chitinophagaceae bacterium]|nr:beta-L-arabinofuranosidase domain-containing protein [Chitinophagaceae bacterium]
MKKILFLYLIIAHQAVGQTHLKMQPVNFSKVTITDAFWKPKLDKVATKTLDACIYQTEIKTPRIRNFEKVARKQGEKHEGIFYDDSDVFKALEAIAYSLKNRPDPALEKKADEWIDKIAAAQLPDGYLNTYYTLGELDKRWTDMSMHEDYNGGHMIEAAVAYFDATGKRKFLDVAIRWADHFDSNFGPGKKDWVTGHQELELALVKLYRVTGQKKYLDLAHWLLEERGKKLAHGYTWTDWKDTAYAQDAVPVREQKEITGHAVRAMYLYTGAADVAAYTGDEGFMKAMRNVWEDVVFRNMYITGGIGSAGSNEGFTIDYDLPNEQAYCETCASVGMVFWNQRMNALTGDAEYADILERSLYNGALDGLSLSGDRFFYGNPLASTGKNSRREWFGTACCPANIARLVASIGNYVYAASDDGIWINLFVGNSSTINVKQTDVALSMQTDYPWDGNVKIKVDPVKKIKTALYIRIPGWARGNAVPGGLYHFTDSSWQKPSLLLNGKPTDYAIEKGYAVINREWEKGDNIEFRLSMPVKTLVSRKEVGEDEGRIAIQRGPLVYCIEGADNQGKALNIIADGQLSLEPEKGNVLDENVILLKGPMTIVTIKDGGTNIGTEKKNITAIPYYTWCNRGSNEMQVWLPTYVKSIRVNSK